eukprot:GHUV01019870.1.p2 GENE.GHUV01019870.1~~GHUV01019870.1.p2  ORF type:complete len:108 (-),score=27.51 GHUV01019870.1:710-1033(-)
MLHALYFVAATQTKSVLVECSEGLMGEMMTVRERSWGIEWLTSAVLLTTALSNLSTIASDSSHCFCCTGAIRDVQPILRMHCCPAAAVEHLLGSGRLAAGEGYFLRQ